MVLAMIETMNNIVFRNGHLAKNLGALGLATVLSPLHAATINATSCSQASVQTAISAAAAGDTVAVPAGSCTWTGVAVNKPVTLRGAGVGTTNITVNTSSSLTLTKQGAGPVRLEGFSFFASGPQVLPHPIVVKGSWQGTQPVIVQNNAFTMNGNAMFDVFVAGGVIFSKNTFTGGWNDFSMTIKDAVNATSWTSADSMGSRDASGILNVYIEGNTFYGQSNGVIDCDDNCRVVMRYNTLTYGGFNSHGKDTSPHGMRHFEIYNNTFLYPNPNLNPLSNVGQYIWIRGGTGVIFNNSMTNITGTMWGNKPEVRLSLRGAEDVRPQGSCAQVSYPVPHQIGRNHNGTSETTDPIYFWNNTGTIQISAAWAWGNPCGLNWTSFFQWGRDAINSAGTGGSPRPGYTPYTYPHPMASSSPQAPGNLRIVTAN